MARMRFSSLSLSLSIFYAILCDMCAFMIIRVMKVARLSPFLSPKFLRLSGIRFSCKRAVFIQFSKVEWVML